MTLESLRKQLLKSVATRANLQEARSIGGRRLGETSMLVTDSNPVNSNPLLVSMFVILKLPRVTCHQALAHLAARESLDDVFSCN